MWPHGSCRAGTDSRKRGGCERPSAGGASSPREGQAGSPESRYRGFIASCLLVACVPLQVPPLMSRGQSSPVKGVQIPSPGCPLRPRAQRHPAAGTAVPGGQPGGAATAKAWSLTTGTIVAPGSSAGETSKKAQNSSGMFFADSTCTKKKRSGF